MRIIGFIGVAMFLFIGLKHLFDKDGAWEIQVERNKSQGIPVSVRPENWEFQNNFLGCFYVIFAMMLCMAVLLSTRG